MKTRSGTSYRVVFAVFFALIAAALTAGAGLYFHKLHYRRVAADHVPKDAWLALRVDAEKVIAYEPVRRHLLPLVDEAAATKLEPKRSKRLQGSTRVELAVDLREVLVAVGPGEGDWVLVVGGLFPKTGVLEGLSRVLAAEGRTVHLDGDVLEVSGVAFGQARDGALVAASSRERLSRALSAERGLELTGDPGVIEAAWRPGAQGTLARLGIREAPPSGRLRAQVTGEVTLRASGGEGAALGQLLTQLGASRVEAAAEGDGDARMGRLSREDLDRAARHLAVWLAPQLGAAPR
ncbi:MAG: hypothetical protein KF718_18015 [Polyangiaceae bacterium]|nr:hypothetical protein [Polyangiaceae bacterium]